MSPDNRALRQVVIEPGCGVRLELSQGQTLRVVDLHGGQVADLMAFVAGDPDEVLSSGQTMDRVRRLFLSRGDALYSNRSNPLLTITADTAGRHDFLFAACDRDMFLREYDLSPAPSGCLESFATCLRRDGIPRERIGTPFNVFMRVEVDPLSGDLTVRPAASRPGDHIDLRAERPLIVAVTACPAPHPCGGRPTPVAVQVVGRSR